MRARAFALRDTCSDILKGLSIAEEVQDYVLVEKNVGGAAGVDLVEAAKGAIVDKAPAKDEKVREGEIVDSKIPEEREIVSHYTVEKVTKSSVIPGLFYITIQGNRHAIADEAVAIKAEGWKKGKTPIAFTSEVKEGGLYLTKIWALEPVPA
jgi:hypothetical protein